ncbi:hypothetical protein OHB14_45340 [Streptomyces sp. NBC_01613]
MSRPGVGSSRSEPGLNLSPGKTEQPPLPVVVVSRLVDAPRRMWSWV